MQTFARFEDIEAWQLARGLTKHVYTVSTNSALRKDYAFCDQIRRAAVSIQANIAEGSERTGRTEFIRYLLMARGSACELRSHLYIAMDTELIDEQDFKELYERAHRMTRVLTALIAFLRRTEPAKTRR